MEDFKDFDNLLLHKAEQHQVQIQPVHDRDEYGRRYIAVLGMIPTGQGFRTHNHIRVQVVLRLQDDMQTRSTTYRGNQIFLQRKLVIGNGRLEYGMLSMHK
ncbi:hypothetical protein D3C71_1781670 [compost metagenome]